MTLQGLLLLCFSFLPPPKKAALKENCNKATVNYALVSGICPTKVPLKSQTTPCWLNSPQSTLQVGFFFWLFSFFPHTVPFQLARAHICVAQRKHTRAADPKSKEDARGGVTAEPPNPAACYASVVLACIITAVMRNRDGVGQA